MTDHTDPDVDVLVIGSGPAGQRAAIAAAKLGRRVAIVERPGSVGGASVHRGTLPSKTFREAAVYLSGLDQRDLYGHSYRVKGSVTIGDLAARVLPVLDAEVDVITNQLYRNRVTMLSGTARFLDAHTVAVDDPTDGRTYVLSADKVIIAVGTRPARPAGVDFDGRTIVDSDTIIGLERIPGRIVVVGAGVIGMEYASMLAALDAQVTVIDRRQRILDFCDAEVVDALRYHLRDLGVVFRLGEEVQSVEPSSDGAVTVLTSGKRLRSDTVLYSAGRVGATDALDLGNAGLEVDARGRIPVDDHFRTSVPTIYAVGDVIGFPALAATSMEQGRRAGEHACGERTSPVSSLQPIGIYTIPEISYIGRTEAELTEARIPYEVGLARYRELARGQIVGDRHGLLKLLVSCADRTVLGVHVFGHGATELVHIGQAVMAVGATVDYFVDAVFNYPTMAEAYKVAGLDAANRLRQAA